MSDEQQQINKIAGFLSRNLRLILLLLLCGLSAGLVVYLKSSKVYQASALIMYQQQQINPTRMSPDVQTRLLEMVNTVGQQVTSLSNLEELIVAHGLYPDLRQRLPMVDVVAAMRRQISIEPQRGANVFRVAYTGDDPRQVMLVANALAAKFIEENIRFREERVSETVAYIRDELAMAKVSLDKQEEGMRDYKLRYYNEMPEQRVANIARLNALQAQYQNIQNNLQDLKRTQILIQEQISLRLAEGQAGVTAGPSELARLRQELEVLRGRYTDSHPDVRRLQVRLETLLEVQRRAAGSGEPAAGDAPGAVSSGGRFQDNQLAQLELQLKEIDISLARLSREQETVRQQIEQVVSWVETTPVREAEWAALTRDYSQLQHHYQALVARSLEAESAEMLERRQKGSQFRIIESAHQPGKPFSPNFRKFMILAAAAGLGLGLSLAYLREFVDTSFKNVKDLEAYLGIAITSAVPLLPTTSEQQWLRLRGTIWAVFLGCGFAALGGVMLLLWYLGLIIL